MAVPVPRRAYVAQRIDRAVAGWLELATGFSASGDLSTIKIIRADQGTPRPSLPYVAYTRVVTGQTSGRDERNINEALATATLTVTASADGEAATLIVNPLRVTHTAAGGEGATGVRDNVVAQLAASVEPVTAVAVGADQFTIAPHQPGELVELRVVEGIAIDSTVAETVQHAQGSRGARIRVQFHGLSDPLESEYADLEEFGDAAVTALTSKPVERLMKSVGVAHNGARPTIQRATVVSGGRTELRVFFDIRLSVWADIARPTSNSVDAVVVAPMTLTAQGPVSP